MVELYTNADLLESAYERLYFKEVWIHECCLDTLIENMNDKKYSGIECKTCKRIIHLIDRISPAPTGILTQEELKLNGKKDN